LDSQRTLMPEHPLFSAFVTEVVCVMPLSQRTNHIL
jgi:hypothetical protein